jgi:hypothetical protein
VLSCPAASCIIVADKSVESRVVPLQHWNKFRSKRLLGKILIFPNHFTDILLTEDEEQLRISYLIVLSSESDDLTDSYNTINQQPYGNLELFGVFLEEFVQQLRQLSWSALTDFM